MAAPPQHRSWMFVPADVQRFVQKSAASNVDIVILDLEDGVLPSRKSTARAALAASVADLRLAGKPVVVRVNAALSVHHEPDVHAAAISGCDFICLPKVATLDDVRVLRSLVERVGGGGPHPELIAVLESARGLVDAARIAIEGEVAALMFGAEDYALDVGLPLSRTGAAARLEFARSTIVNAAAAAGAISVDGVHPVVGTSDALHEDILFSRQLGFSGKTLFHPSHIDPINAAFSPTDDEVAFAEKVLSAFRDAQSRDLGAVAVDGNLVDLPVVERARRLLAGRGE